MMNEKEANEILKKELLCNKKSMYDCCDYDCSDVECDECDLYVPRNELYNAMETVVEYMARCIK